MKTTKIANLKDSIHRILHGSKEDKEKLHHTYFYMADTPDFMKKMGLTGDYFSVKYGVISRHLGKDADHSLKEKDWIDLCDEIIKPFAIAQHGEGYRLFVNLKLNRVFIAVGASVKNPRKGLEVNSIVTAFAYRGVPVHERLIFITQKLTPEQAALLKGLNSPQYPPKQGPDH